MRRSTRLAVPALLAGLLVAAPVSASASTIYPPVDACASDAEGAGAGDTITFECDDRTFGANERVTITVTGENGAGATFAMVRTAISTGSTVRESDASGALAPVEITLPSDARGVYNIAAVSATSAGGTASAVVTSSDEGSILPISGFDSNQLLGLWIGGGALILAGAVIVGAAALRRHRDRTDD
ncbi:MULTISPECIES: cell wall protein [unclassified Microbacterium]|uniref:cell wall protein n=1 Tax=unclassified Microbacterium TaxID=2609290 RepID=UPI00386554A6